MEDYERARSPPEESIMARQLLERLNPAIEWVLHRNYAKGWLIVFIEDDSTSEPDLKGNRRRLLMRSFRFYHKTNKPDKKDLFGGYAAYYEDGCLYDEQS
jgi:hypothetical protein